MASLLDAVNFSKKTLLHCERLQVRWGDMDALGHVNNSTYLVYFEQARQAWLDKILQTQTQTQTQQPKLHVPVLAQAEVVYKRPVIYPCTLDVEVHVLQLGRTSVIMGHKIHDAQHTACCYTTGQVRVVWVAAASGRPHPIPQFIRQVLQHHLED